MKNKIPLQPASNRVEPSRSHDAGALIEYQPGAVVSREVLRKKTGTVTLFAFDAGQGLSEHTAPFDALVERYVGSSACVEAVKEGGRASFGESLREIDRLLAGKRWAIGNRFSVVDAYLLVFYRWGSRNGFAVKDLPHYTALVERLLARPAVRKVMADEGITLA